MHSISIGFKYGLWPGHSFFKRLSEVDLLGCFGHKLMAWHFLIHGKCSALTLTGLQSALHCFPFTLSHTQAHLLMAELLCSWPDTPGTTLGSVSCPRTRWRMPRGARNRISGVLGITKVFFWQKWESPFVQQWFLPWKPFLLHLFESQTLTSGLPFYRCSSGFFCDLMDESLLLKIHHCFLYLWIMALIRSASNHTWVWLVKFNCENMIN